MSKTYKIGEQRFDEIGLERMYHVLEELRFYHVYDMERYIVLSACMEELAKRSKRLKALAEKTLAEKSRKDHIWR